VVHISAGQTTGVYYSTNHTIALKQFSGVHEVAISQADSPVPERFLLTAKQCRSR